MATTDRETIILDLKVDQGSAITELEQTKRVIIGVKEEQQKLNKAYKDGEITQEEYAKELVRVEGVLKTSQSQYNNIQKSVTGVKTQMDKLIESNKKISAEFQNAANNIRVAGVSVGDLTTRLTAFANPAVAALGVVTALGAAYARSSIGAKDLEFASNQLSFTIDALTDSFARNFSSVEDGEGAVTSLFNRYLKFNENMPTGKFLKLLGIDLKEIREQSFNAAQAMEALQNVREESALAQATINERNAETADLMADVANTELKIIDRLNAANKIRENIKQNAKELELFKNREILAELEILRIRKESGGDTGDIEFRINKLVAERAAISTNEERQNTKIEKQINSINNAEGKRLDTVKKQREETERRIKAQDEASDREFRNRQVSFSDDPTTGQEQNPIFDSVVEFRTAEEIKRDEALKTSMAIEATEKAQTDVFLEQQEIRFAAASAATAALTTLAVTAFGQNSEIAKATGITEAIVNTYTGATLALRSSPPPLSFALAALTIANGLASVSQITRAAGGGNFVTKGPALMLVGDNPGGRERVTVEPLSGRGQTRVAGNRIAMAGGGTLTTGFDDGGIQKNGAVSQMQQALMFTNAIKNLPKPVVGVKQFVDVQNSLEVVQSVAQA